MLRGALLVIGMALTLLPGQAAGQEVGASFRVSARAAQPDLVLNGSAASGVAAQIPAGWAWSVSRGAGGGSGSPVTARRESVAVAVSLPASVGSSLADPTVTWMFVPL